MSPDPTEQRSVEEVQMLVNALVARGGNLSSRSQEQQGSVEVRVTESGSRPYYMATYTLANNDERWIIVWIANLGNGASISFNVGKKQIHGIRP